MKLSIPPNSAIKILSDRLRELDNYPFNPKAWVDRTVLDLREIFQYGTQWLQVSSIRFDTYITANQNRVLNEGKDTAKKLVASYIQFIKDYAEIAIVKKAAFEKGFEGKYNDLLKDWNELVPGYNELIKNYDSALTSQEELLNEIEARDAEINRLETETIQLDSVSFKKLWTAFVNLPTGELVTVIGILLAILGGSFGIGVLVENTRSNNESFELKRSNVVLGIEKEKLKYSNDSLKSIVVLKTDSLNKIAVRKGRDSTKRK
ncbi:hypothetical protein [Pedobacter frigoris]|uniref:hypothetical protein n=1 Tax=Pedobacter frigoris TaxID=2571272 RepID=UPI002930934D|nr:hypothetical protein [Pedobacter frigoris]